jgi:cell division septum initiation protein DivIVA
MEHPMESSVDYELVAQQVGDLLQKIAALEARVAAAEKVAARLEVAALTTARALQEVSRHWDAVYEAMRRTEEPDDGAAADVRGEQYGSGSRTPE